MTTSPPTLPAQRTATASIEISCPPWCDVAAQSHADNLHDVGGVIHHYPPVDVPDSTGYLPEPLAERVFCNPVQVACYTYTRPDGRAQADPIIFINGHETTFSQARALADALTALVDDLEGVER